MLRCSARGHSPKIIRSWLVITQVIGHGPIFSKGRGEVILGDTSMSILSRDVHSLQNLRTPGETAGLGKEQWLERMEKESTLRDVPPFPPKTKTSSQTWRPCSHLFRSPSSEEDSLKKYAYELGAEAVGTHRCRVVESRGLFPLL